MKLPMGQIQGISLVLWCCWFFSLVNMFFAQIPWKSYEIPVFDGLKINVPSRIIRLNNWLVTQLGTVSPLSGRILPLGDTGDTGDTPLCRMPRILPPSPHLPVPAGAFRPESEALEAERCCRYAATASCTAVRRSWEIGRLAFHPCFEPWKQSWE